MDDPDIAEKMAADVEGILLWAFEGLQRLVKNGFQFTESDRAKHNRELVKRDNNNAFDFLESEGYIRLKTDACTSSKELYAVYKMWCEENSLNAIKARGVSDALIANQRRYISVSKRRPHYMSRVPLLIFCVLTIWKHLLKMRFERSGRGQEPSRGHKFSILENVLSIRDFTSAMHLHFRSDLVGACLPQTLLMVRT